MKWYEDFNINQNIIISSRIRLARNIKDYPFSEFINEEQSKNLLQIVKNSVFSCEVSTENNFEFIDFEEISPLESVSMMENHTVSLDFIKKELPKGLLLKKDESISIMINEEDHIRIQSVISGNNIEKAFDIANEIDDLLEEKLDYAFNNDFGYLTSCVTNVGTGMRASFMVHIPMLEKYRHINEIGQNLTKLGMTIRGIYGEGSETLGGIYQISNQTTLGNIEKEIMYNLKIVIEQIVEREEYLRNTISKEENINLIDKIFRSYGIIQNCKKISNKEALEHLSNIWLGISINIFQEKKIFKYNIYHIMTSIQPANLTKKFQNINNSDEFDIFRAKYLNEVFY